jgi:hypothetical protein
MPFGRSSVADYVPATSVAHVSLYVHSAPLTTCGVCLASRSGEPEVVWKNDQAVNEPARMAEALVESMWKCSMVLRERIAARAWWARSGRGACLFLRAHPVYGSLVSILLSMVLRCDYIPDRSPSRTRRGSCVTKPGQLQRSRQARSRCSRLR